MATKTSPTGPASPTSPEGSKGSKSSKAELVSEIELSGSFFQGLVGVAATEGLTARGIGEIAHSYRFDVGPWAVVDGTTRQKVDNWLPNMAARIADNRGSVYPRAEDRQSAIDSVATMLSGIAFNTGVFFDEKEEKSFKNNLDIYHEAVKQLNARGPNMGRKALNAVGIVSSKTSGVWNAGRRQVGRVRNSSAAHIVRDRAELTEAQDAKRDLGKGYGGAVKLAAGLASPDIWKVVGDRYRATIKDTRRGALKAPFKAATNGAVRQAVFHPVALVRGEMASVADKRKSFLQQTALSMANAYVAARVAAGGERPSVKEQNAIENRYHKALKRMTARVVFKTAKRTAAFVDAVDDYGTADFEVVALKNDYESSHTKLGRGALAATRVIKRAVTLPGTAAAGALTKVENRRRAVDPEKLRRQRKVLRVMGGVATAALILL